MCKASRCVVVAPQCNAVFLTKYAVGEPPPPPLRLVDTLQNSWDVAAGALIIQEAGGQVTDIDGTPYGLSTRAIIGSNKLVHEEVRNVLVQAGSTRPDMTPQL